MNRHFSKSKISHSIQRFYRTTIIDILSVLFDVIEVDVQWKCYLEDGGVISNDSEGVILSYIRVLTGEESYDVTHAYGFLHHSGTVQTNVERSFVHV